MLRLYERKLLTLQKAARLSPNQTADSSDEETLHIDTEAKPEVKSRNSKVKKKSGSAAGILDLLQASKQVGGIDYSNNRYSYCVVFSFHLSWNKEIVAFLATDLF